VDTDALRVFEAVGSSSSFSRAAQDLAMSQSAVSRRIRSLEGEFGVRLIERSTRSVRLTPSGHALRQ